MNEERYQQLALALLPSFHRMAYSLLHNRQDAEDAVSQMLLKAWQCRAKAREGEERAWMMRILLNECYTLLRRRNRMQPCDLLPDAAAPGDPTETAALRAVIATLSEPLRIPFLLKYMEGMTEKEIAQTLHLSQTGVKNRLLRARQKLQKQLREEVGS